MDGIKLTTRQMGDWTEEEVQELREWHVQWEGQPREALLKQEAVERLRIKIAARRLNRSSES